MTNFCCSLWSLIFLVNFLSVDHRVFEASVLLRDGEHLCRDGIDLHLVCLIDHGSVRVLFFFAAV